MKTIQKLTMTTESKLQTLTLVRGYRIVRVEYLVTEKRICLWVEVPVKADIPSDRKEFVVKKSYETVPDEYEYVSTAIDLLAPQSYHIYEVCSVSHSTQVSNLEPKELSTNSNWAA